MFGAPGESIPDRLLGDPRKSIVGHPDAILFLRILREGVFQQPQAFTRFDRWSTSDIGMFRQPIQITFLGSDGRGDFPAPRRERDHPEPR